MHESYSSSAVMLVMLHCVQVPKLTLDTNFALHNIRYLCLPMATALINMYLQNSSLIIRNIIVLLDE